MKNVELTYRTRWDIPKNMTREESEERSKKIQKALEFHQERLRQVENDLESDDGELKGDHYWGRILEKIHRYQTGMVQTLKAGYLYPGELPDALLIEYFPDLAKKVAKEPLYPPEKRAKSRKGAAISARKKGEIKNMKTGGVKK